MDRSKRIQSSSNIEVRTNKCVFDWTINGFDMFPKPTSQSIQDEVIRSSEAWETIESAHFSVEKGSLSLDLWKLIMKPFKTVEKKEYVAIYLQKVSGNETRRVQFKIYLTDGYGRKKHTHEGVYDFKRNSFFGWDNFVSRNELSDTEEQLLLNNTLRVGCEMIMYDLMQIGVGIVKNTDCNQICASDDFSLLYKNLYEDKTSCDAVLEADGEKFPVHKAVLSAHSFIFKYRFENAWKGKKLNNSVEISDITTPVKISDVTSPVKISDVTAPVGISDVTTPVGIFNATAPGGKICDVTAPVEISDMTTPVKISDVTSPVKISDVIAPVKISDVTAPVGISDVTPVGIFNATAPGGKICAVTAPVKISDVTATVKISDVTAPVLELMIEYMYCGKITNDSPEILLGLYKCAEKYCIWNLRSKCSTLLSTNMNADTVFEIIISAHQQHDHVLFDAAKSFLLSQPLNILASDGWLQLLQSFPDLAQDITKDEAFALNDHKPIKTESISTYKPSSTGFPFSFGAGLSKIANPVIPEFTSEKNVTFNHDSDHGRRQRGARGGKSPLLGKERYSA